MSVTRHTRVTSEKVKDEALATVDYGDATITEAKFSEHLEHGTITGVTLTGRYKTLTGFSGVPDVVITGIDANAQLGTTPVAGSFSVKLDAAGTANAHFIAWGVRA